jgi:hypothetical protein
MHQDDFNDGMMWMFGNIDYALLHDQIQERKYRSPEWRHRVEAIARLHRERRGHERIAGAARRAAATVRRSARPDRAAAVVPREGS